jgi:uncharacterized protein (DUF1330 family)
MIYLTQLIYVREGREAAFDRFEDAVLRLLSKYRGDLLLRLRPGQGSKIDGSCETPYEVHVVRFESDEDLSRYFDDEERQLLLPLKEQSVRNALVIKGTAT